MPLSAEQIAALIERHAVPLAIWIGHQEGWADDVVQEAFCRLAAANPPPDWVVPWLYRVAWNLAQTQRLSTRRRRSREKQAATREAVREDPLQRLIDDEVLAAVLSLDGPLREVVTARIWGGLGFREIGKLCGTSAATALRRYRDALERLHKLLSAPCTTTTP
jgi:RNA polymerase sigma factor (sigma-70 family)